MKKALTLIVLVLTPTMAFAQGTVVFDNDSSGLVRLRNWTDPTSFSVPVGGTQVELLAAPAGTGVTGTVANYGSLAIFLAANPGWQAVGTSAINLAPGLFNGGTMTIANINPGANAGYFVIGWSGEAGGTLDQALTSGAYIGSSAVITTRTGDPTTTPPGTPVQLSDTFTGMTLTPGCLDPAFYFTAQPTNQTVVEGGPATFSAGVFACRAPSYQWYQWYVNGVSIPGLNSSSFQISNAQLMDAGTYWLVVSSSEWGVHMSGSATLTVLAERRGRDVSCPTPPSQIPAGGFPAPGSSSQLALAYADGWVTGHRSSP